MTTQQCDILISQQVAPKQKGQAIQSAPTWSGISSGKPLVWRTKPTRSDAQLHDINPSLVEHSATSPSSISILRVAEQQAANLICSSYASWTTGNHTDAKVFWGNLWTSRLLLVKGHVDMACYEWPWLTAAFHPDTRAGSKLRLTQEVIGREWSVSDGGGGA